MAHYDFEEKVQAVFGKSTTDLLVEWLTARLSAQGTSHACNPGFKVMVKRSSQAVIAQQSPQAPQGCDRNGAAGNEGQLASVAKLRERLQWCEQRERRMKRAVYHLDRVFSWLTLCWGEPVDALLADQAADISYFAFVCSHLRFQEDDSGAACDAVSPSGVVDDAGEEAEVARLLMQLEGHNAVAAVLRRALDFIDRTYRSLATTHTEQWVRDTADSVAEVAALRHFAVRVTDYDDTAFSGSRSSASSVTTTSPSAAVSTATSSCSSPPSAGDWCAPPQPSPCCLITQDPQQQQQQQQPPRGSSNLDGCTQGSNDIGGDSSSDCSAFAASSTETSKVALRACCSSSCSSSCCCDCTVPLVHVSSQQHDDGAAAIAPVTEEASNGGFSVSHGKDYDGSGQASSVGDVAASAPASAHTPPAGWENAAAATATAASTPSGDGDVRSAGPRGPGGDLGSCWSAAKLGRALREINGGKGKGAEKAVAVVAAATVPRYLQPTASRKHAVRSRVVPKLESRPAMRFRQQ